MRASKSYKEKVHDKVPWKQQVIATPVMDVAFQTNRQHGRFGLTRRKEQDQLFWYLTLNSKMTVVNVWNILIDNNFTINHTLYHNMILFKENFNFKINK